MHPTRCSFIKDACLEHFKRKKDDRKGSKPLSGLRIVDVGCGGGLLSESLSRLGADVVGIDVEGKRSC